MATATQAIPQAQMQKWSDAVQEFVSDIFKKYPSLDDSFIPKLIEETKALGLMREYISSRALWGAFRNCVADGRIVLPAVEPTLTPEAIAKLVSKYPVIIKTDRQISQRERSALAGVSPISNNHAADVRDNNRKIDDAYAAERASRDKTRLRQEYRELRAKAETVMGENPKSHAQTNQARKDALQKLNADPRFLTVRDN
jgi:hypothetical protein